MKCAKCKELIYTAEDIKQSRKEGYDEGYAEGGCDALEEERK